MSACMCDFALLNCSFFCWWFFKSTYILRILILYIWCKYFFPLYRSPFHFVCWVSTKSWKPKVGFSEVATMAFLYVVFHFRSLQPKSTYYSIFSCGTYMVTFFTLKPVIHLDFTAVSGWVLTPSEPPGLAPSWWLPACGRMMEWQGAVRAVTAGQLIEDLEIGRYCLLIGLGFALPWLPIPPS